MIRYSIGALELHRWIERAAERTAGFREAGRYRERNSIWSEVKPVFMEIQSDKCCFCERKFASGDLGRHELDLEHFRPKGRVTPWPCPGDLLDSGVHLTDPPAANGGYYLLAYHLCNYAVACKACNSGLKDDFFPVGGEYKLTGDEPAAMTAEEPWLLYPIGDLDDNPEDIIGFHGFLPMAIATDERDKLRGLVTIAFFELSTRKELLRDRAFVIVALYLFLVNAARGQDAAGPLVDAMTASQAAHASCARSFRRLFSSDPNRAAKVEKAAAAYLASGSL